MYSFIVEVDLFSVGGFLLSRVRDGMVVGYQCSKMFRPITFGFVIGLKQIATPRTGVRLGGIAWRGSASD